MLPVIYIFASLVIMFIIFLLLPVKVYINYSRLNQDDCLRIQARALFGLINYQMEISYIKIRRWLLFPFMELHANLFGAKGSKPVEEIDTEIGPQSIDLKTLLKKLKFLIKITDQFEALMEMIEGYRNEEKHSDELSLQNAVIYRILGMLVMSIRGNCEKFYWVTHFGFSDPALTGLTSGLIWAGKSVFLEILSLLCNMKTEAQIMVYPSFRAAGVDTKFESIFSVRIGNIMNTGLKILLEGYKRRKKNRWSIIQLKD